MSNTRVTVFLSVCLSRLPFLKAYTFAVARRVMMTVRIKFVIAPLAGVLVGLVLVCLYETLLSFVTDRQQSNDVRQLSVVGLHSTEPPSTGTTDKRSVELDCSQHTAAQKAVIAQLTKQRDELSHQLNELQERHQRLLCDALSSHYVAEAGPFCNMQVGAHHVTDLKLIIELCEQLFVNKSVAVFGDSQGIYRRFIHDTGKVLRVDAYDGSPHINATTKNEVRFIDLTLPQYWLPRYDWVMSLNVIEHIPEQFETIVLDNVARAAGEGIVMSWATTSQEGFQHVNRREPSHVNRVMAARKFYRDESAINKMREAATFAWFKVTIGVFRRTDVF